MTKELVLKRENATKRASRTRKAAKGSETRPRLSVAVSNRHIFAQIINDDAHRTIVAVTTIHQKNIGTTMTEKATWIGQEIAKKASKAKIDMIVFDRGSKLFHGRIKALAEAARAGGLKF